MANHRKADSNSRLAIALWRSHYYWRNFKSRTPQIPFHLIPWWLNPRQQKNPSHIIFKFSIIGMMQINLFESLFVSPSWLWKQNEKQNEKSNKRWDARAVVDSSLQRSMLGHHRIITDRFNKETPLKEELQISQIYPVGPFLQMPSQNQRII